MKVAEIKKIEFNSDFPELEEISAKLDKEGRKALYRYHQLERL